MRISSSVLLIAIIGCVFQLFMPWWSLAIAAFLIGLAMASGGAAFIAGFIGSALIWWSYSLIIQIQTHGLLAEKIAILFKMGNPFLLLVAGGLIAGVVGGFAALSGTLLRQITRKR